MMLRAHSAKILLFAMLVWLFKPALLACAEKFFPFVPPEQRRIEVRDPDQLPRIPIPDLPPPRTVSERTGTGVEPLYLSLDEAIRTALANSQVVRVLAGVTASSSGQTIYEPAITNTQIDEQNAVFDPTLTLSQTFNRAETPQATFDPANPGQSLIEGLQTDSSTFQLGLQKRNAIGGTTSLNVNSTESRFDPGVFPLDPELRSSLDLGYTQPLLQGGGLAANMAPIVVARIQTERSFFQLKDSVQELVRGVIEGYWALVFARTDEWARQQQVEQGLQALQLAEAQQRVGLRNIGDVVQARVAFGNFRANLIAAQSNRLQREEALRNLLGIPPLDNVELIPTTPPRTEPLPIEWDTIVRLAEQRRPDLIELKLILEADQQNLILARNNALPRADAVAVYRWNGLEGEVPTGMELQSGPGQFTGYTLGVNFSVPLGLRAGRAQVRRQELVIARDRAQLDQGLHQAIYQIAATTRSLDNTYQQYRVFTEVRDAAFDNVQYQSARWRTEQALFLNLLQAITDWGNAVSAQAQSLAEYNSLLATLERQTGTILETHGVRFYEERWAFVGPLGHPRLYPAAQKPTPNSDVYPDSGRPAEDFFELERPQYLREPEPLETPAPQRLPDVQVE